MQEAVEMDTELMDKKVITIAKRQAENKRKAYTAGTGEKKPYGGSKTLCAKCNYHHDDPRAPKCHKCNKVGHFARDCRSVGNANNANNQRGTGSGQKPTCFECEARRVEARRVENHTIFAFVLGLATFIEGTTVLNDLAALTGAVVLEKLCLAVLHGTRPDLVKTAVGAKFLLELEKF
ncbi:putative reverse transcriptase domain-containing protein [Tanacetum coccineum]